MPNRSATNSSGAAEGDVAPPSSGDTAHDSATTLQGGYRPFLYTRRGKRAGQAYLLQHVLLEDVLILALAFCWFTPRPVVAAAGILILHLSFWLVYEIGYWENDTLAVTRESTPTYPVNASAMAHRMKPRWAWLTALLLAIPGGWLVVAGAGSGLRDWTGALGAGAREVAVLLVGWVLYLLASRGCFWIYNRLAPESRVLPYAVLQMLRTLGYSVFLEVGLVGAMALLAVVLVRWMPYQAYRSTGVQPDVSHRLLLLFAFLVLIAAAVAVAPQETLSSGQAGILLLLFTARAHRPLRALAQRTLSDLRH